jgi:hypothetical protein
LHKCKIPIAINHGDFETVASALPGNWNKALHSAKSKPLSSVREDGELANRERGEKGSREAPL